MRRDQSIPTGIHRILVIGSGMMGCSVALAQRRLGVEVFLADRDRETVTRAQRLGIGSALGPGTPQADVVVIATPPSAVVGVLREAQRRDLGLVYTDVAGAKGRIAARAELHGCDLDRYVMGHPMAGSERSGPEAARPDLFTGRVWALCPTERTAPGALRLVARLAQTCGSRTEIISPQSHDLSVAAVSHVPHLLASALAAHFAHGDEAKLRLAGKGLGDMTRIAAGAADLWCDVLTENADFIADALQLVVDDLAEVVLELRGAGPRGRVGSGGGSVSERQGPRAALMNLLVRGVDGRENITYGRLPGGQVAPPPAA